MWITRTSINQPVFATMVMVALVVTGAFCYRLLPVEHMPEINNPLVFISALYPGASPEAIESDVIKPIENAVNSVNGITSLLATAREGRAFFEIEFSLETDIAVATQEVRDKVAQIRGTLPREMRDPQITRATNDTNSPPVVSLVVYSDERSLREVSTLVDQQIVKRLQNVSGVGNVSVNGEVKRQIQVLLRPEQLQSYRVGVDQVINAIQAANQDLPAGSISQGAREQLVRVEGRIKDVRGFERIIVANQSGAPVYLGQVANVVDGEAEEFSIARANGQRTVALNIFNVQGANVVATGKAVDEALEELRERLPKDVHVEVLFSGAEFIESSLNRVKSTILEGAALTILIVFLFLHSWRSTVITGLTLPISVIATFIVVYAFGFTLNFLTLMALSLCIGLLIDDAIVVRENIVRHGDMGKDHRQASLEGTQEIGLAVMATTFAILAVFIPVAFMQGVIGRFFYQFGITVAVAVLVSLIVSFTLDPMLSSVWPDPKEGRFRRLPWLARCMDYIEHLIERAHAGYDRILRWALSERRYAFTAGGKLKPTRLNSVSPRLLLVLLALSSFLGSFMLVGLVGSEFVPEEDDGTMQLRLSTRIGSSLQYTDAKVHDVEDFIRALPGVQSVITNIGTNDGRNHARLLVRLTDPEKRPPKQEIEKAIRERVANMAGLEVLFDQNNGPPVSISILGPDSKRLTAISEEFIAKLQKIPGITDIESSEKGSTPAIAVRIKNEMASDAGLTNARIGNALRPLIAGDQISTWLGPDGQDYEVIAQLPKQRREIGSDLADLYITSSRVDAQGNPLLVPLRQVADFVATGSPQIIKRLNLQRRVSITAGAEGRPGGDVANDARAIMKEMKLPDGYRFDIGGNQKDMIDTFNAALAALGLAVVFIYLVLASQFGSFLQPLAIMASLPLSLVGVLLALLVTGTTLNIFSVIGFIMLMGLVTKNAILLVDFTNQAIRAGRTVREAILEAGQVRLRPILMTTLAMIFGMMPMSIGAGQGGEILAPMGRAVIGGVITSTILTLLIVPVLYTYMHSITARVRRWRGKEAASQQPPEMQPGRLG